MRGEGEGQVPPRMGGEEPGTEVCVYSKKLSLAINMHMEMHIFV